MGFIQDINFFQPIPMNLQRSFCLWKKSYFFLFRLHFLESRYHSVPVKVGPFVSYLKVFRKVEVKPEQQKAIDQFLPIDGYILNVNTQINSWDYNFLFPAPEVLLDLYRSFIFFCTISMTSRCTSICFSISSCSPSFFTMFSSAFLMAACAFSMSFR